MSFGVGNLACSSKHTISRKVWGIWVLAALVHAWPAAGAETQTGATDAKTKGNPPVGDSVLSGVFTKSQASRGSKRFQQVCAGCHRPEDIKTRWFHGTPLKTVGDMFEQITTTMPAGKPGSLTPKEYTDIIAFVLRSKEYPSGETELPADPAVLKKVRLPTS